MRRTTFKRSFIISSHSYRKRKKDSTTIASVTSIAKFFTHSAFVGFC